MLKTIAWNGQSVELLDQTQLPSQTRYVPIENERQMWDAIHRLVVRGAPAIGIAAAFGVYLGVRRYPPADVADLHRKLDEVCAYLATSRPTAVNLFWALDRMKRIARHEGLHAPAEDAQAIARIKQRLLDEALAMIEEDNHVCRSIGQHGLDLLLSLNPQPRPGNPLNILTHCNAGGLATAQFGTALAPVYVGAQRGHTFQVYADETRPLLQGSRITAYELHANGIPVTVICDNMAAVVLSRRNVHAVLVGTDRVAANGDVANKIGTYGLAILARHFHVPFFVAAPTSSIDLSIATGAQIPIEYRDRREVACGLGCLTAPEGVEIYNPAFDVTPAGLVSAIITEKGVVQAPYEMSLRGLF